jgi:uncharacterized iron-regulated membrane protein
VRGGAIPLLAWGTLLLVLYAGNWIWEGKLVPALETSFAIVVIYAGGVILWLSRREAIKRGPPPAQAKVEALPTISVAATVAGLSVGTFLFGLVWTTFLIAFGAGVLCLSLGRIALEVRAQQRSRSRLAEGGPE